MTINKFANANKFDMIMVGGRRLEAISKIRHLEVWQDECLKQLNAQL